jgi:DNA-binding MarR family transcriptional regulator
MMRRYEWLHNAGMSQATKYGFGYVTPAMARLFEHMSDGPITLSELARTLAITRQSLQETVAAAIEHGLVALGRDPDDRRVRILTYTDRGRRMAQLALASDRRIERNLARRIGEENVEALRRILNLEW